MRHCDLTPEGRALSAGLQPGDLQALRDAGLILHDATQYRLTLEDIGLSHRRETAAKLATERARDERDAAQFALEQLRAAISARAAEYTAQAAYHGQGAVADVYAAYAAVLDGVTDAA